MYSMFNIRCNVWTMSYICDIDINHIKFKCIASSPDVVPISRIEYNRIEL